MGNKAISVFIPAGYRQKYGDSVASMHVIRSYILVGYALVIGRNMRDYLLLAKEEDTEYVRGFFNGQDAVFNAAYEIYLQHYKPKLYWTSLYMIGVQAIHEHILPFVGQVADKASVASPLPYAKPACEPVNKYHRPRSTVEKKQAKDTANIEVGQSTPAASSRTQSLKGLMAGGKTRKLNQ